MELIKFIRDNRSFLNIRNIERKCNIPQGLVGKCLKGKCLPQKHGDSLIGLFKMFDVVLTHVAIDNRKNTPDGYELLPSNWVKTVSGKYRSPDGRKEVAVEINGKLYIPKV